MQDQATIPIISSIAPFAEGRAAWLVDIWGVIHNGVTPFLPAADACAKFRARGGTVLLLSNAPRPAASVVDQLDRIGVPKTAYDTILTSGDASRELIVRAVHAGRTSGTLVRSGTWASFKVWLSGAAAEGSDGGLLGTL